MLPSLATLVLFPTPRWFDASLAGYALAYDETHRPTGVRDPKTGFMLVRGVECDGGLLTLLLTRDRKGVVAEGFKVPGVRTAEGYDGELAMAERPLPCLRTGKGVAVGDSPDAVRRRLGPPTKVRRHGRFLDYVYTGRTRLFDPWLKEKLAAEQEQRYTFKAGRLIEIEFFRDATGDGGVVLTASPRR